MAWLKERRKALAKPVRAAPTTVDSINVPNCPGSRIRGLVPTALAPEGTPDLVTVTSSCASTPSTFAHDAEAFNQGWATLVKVSVPPQ